MKKEYFAVLLVITLALPVLAMGSAPQAPAAGPTTIGAPIGRDGTVTFEAIADTWIYANQPEQNYGNGLGWKDVTNHDDTSFVPLISVGSSGGEVKIGLLKFDLSGLDNNRPARSANLLIYNCFAGSDVPLNIEARLITEPWDEDTVTYNNRPAAKETLSTLTLQGVRTFSDPGKWYSFDVTQAVEAWQLGAANNGIMLVPQGDASVYFEFVCKEAAGAPDRRPKLEITY